MCVFAVVFTLSTVTVNWILTVDLVCVTDLSFSPSRFNFCLIIHFKSSIFPPFVDCFLFLCLRLFGFSLSLLSLARLPFPKSSCSASLISSLFHVLICLIFFFPPQPRHLISFPIPSNTLLIFRCHFHSSCFPPSHVILYFVLFTISFLFPIHPFLLMRPSLPVSRCLISYCCLSAAKKGLFHFNYLRESIKEVLARRIRIES